MYYCSIKQDIPRVPSGSTYMHVNKCGFLIFFFLQIYRINYDVRINFVYSIYAAKDKTVTVLCCGNVQRLTPIGANIVIAIAEQIIFAIGNCHSGISSRG